MHIGVRAIAVTGAAVAALGLAVPLTVAAASAKSPSSFRPGDVLRGDD